MRGSDMITKNNVPAVNKYFNVNLANQSYISTICQQSMDYVNESALYGYYKYNDILVPRVSRILDVAIGNKGLVDWAARVGYSKMNSIRDSALAVGSLVHEMIEYNLNTNADKDINFSDYNLDDHDIQSVICSYNNYKVWKDHLISTGNKIDKIIGTEIPVVCPWYGGTIDCIMVINGATYIIDFKTSKQISLNYILQVCAYAWIVNANYSDICPKIDGVGILRFDKRYEGQFEEYFVTASLNQPLWDHYTNTFWSICNSFYNIVYSTDILNQSIILPEYQIPIKE